MVYIQFYKNGFNKKTLYIYIYVYLKYKLILNVMFMFMFILNRIN